MLPVLRLVLFGPCMLRTRTASPVELARQLPDAPQLTLTRMAIEPVAVVEFLGSNLNDRLPRASLGRVENGDGVIE
jgi:hypothetical protein